MKDPIMRDYLRVLGIGAVAGIVTGVLIAKLFFGV